MRYDLTNINIIYLIERKKNRDKNFSLERFNSNVTVLANIVSVVIANTEKNRNEKLQVAVFALAKIQKKHDRNEIESNRQKKTSRQTKNSTSLLKPNGALRINQFRLSMESAEEKSWRFCIYKL